MKKFAAATALLILPCLIYAAGTVGPDFLRIDPPARTAAMSDAFCAIADDSNGPLFNPAGLAYITKTTLSLTHYASFVDTDYEYLSFAMPFGIKLGTFGASFMFDSTYNFDHIDGSGNVVGKVNNYDMLLTASYGCELLPGISAGANLKYFFSQLYTYSNKGIAADAGMIFKLNKNPDTFAGITLQNMGYQTAYISVPDTMPLNLKAGMGLKNSFTDFFDLTAVMDVNRLLVTNDLPTLDMGIEAGFYHIVFLRLGFGLRHSDNNLSVGLGFEIEKKAMLSYAYQPFGNLGDTHRLSLDWEF
jgi:hypothetical protein